MSDLIDRNDAIKAVKVGALSAATIYGRTDEGSTALYETVRAIKAIPSAQPYSLDEWCDTCKEYDHETHSCPRFNRVIRETLDDVRKEAYKHGKSKGIKRGMAMARRKEAGND